MTSLLGMTYFSAWGGTLLTVQWHDFQQSKKFTKLEITPCTTFFLNTEIHSDIQLLFHADMNDGGIYLFKLQQILAPMYDGYLYNISCFS